jgi:phosphohistidine phosphatase
MKIYLVRHAIAIDFGTQGYNDDSLRPLTKEGRAKMKRIASALKALEVMPNLIVTSPYVRARQTAEVVIEGIGYQGELAQSFNLIPSADSGDMIKEINKKYAVDELMLVGHEPSMSALTSVLLTGNSNLSINFKKGGVFCLTVDDLQRGHKAVVEWYIPPGIATKIS